MPVATAASSVVSAAPSQASSPEAAQGVSAVLAQIGTPPVNPVPSLGFASNDAWLSGFATLVGGLAASYVAYKLQVRAAKKREREQGLVEAHHLMFCLVQQINTILLVWIDHFSEHVDEPGRFMNVPAAPPIDLERHIVDVAKMTILLDCPAGRSVLYDLNIAQEGFRQAAWIVNERSRVHRADLQPAIEKSKLNGLDVDHELMMDELGERLMLTMVGLTDGCYASLHNSFVKLAAVKDTARRYLVARFGSDDFTKVDFPETKGIEKQPRAHYPSRPHRITRRSGYSSFGTAYNWCRIWSLGQGRPTKSQRPST
jgi:hypothetical protein